MSSNDDSSPLLSGLFFGFLISIYLYDQLGAAVCLVGFVGIVAILVSFIVALENQAAVGLFWTSPFWLPHWLAAWVSLCAVAGYPTRRLAIRTNTIEVMISIWWVYTPIGLGLSWFGINLGWLHQVLPFLLAVGLSLWGAGLSVYLYFDLLEKLPRKGITWIPFITAEALYQQKQQLNQVMKMLKKLNSNRQDNKEE